MFCSIIGSVQYIYHVNVLDSVFSCKVQGIAKMMRVFFVQNAPLMVCGFVVIDLY